tara:strand:- start:309 stop:1001 length:693 start_codon:yes stop_codon:yes gene_type:complete
MPKLIKTSKSEVAPKVVSILKKSIKDLSKNKDYITLAIPGGRSVIPIFKLLKQDKRISWKKINIFMVDERLVPINHKDSNFKLAKNLFLDHLLKSGRLPEENVHPFILKKEKDQGIKFYEKDLKRYKSRYDIILLSSGEDGHIGALYPNHNSITNNAKYFITMKNSPKPPKNRMSMSKNLLLRSKVVILLFTGNAKKQAYEKFLDNNIKIIDCPCKLIQKVPRSYVITDI